MTGRGALAVLLLAGAIAFALWLARGGDAEPASPAAPVREAETRTRTDEANGAIEAPPRDEPRTTIAAEPAMSDDFAMPYAFALRVRAIDEFGLPVPEQEIRLSPIDCTRNAFAQRTDQDGVVVLQWRGRTPWMQMAVAVAANAPREVAMHSGARNELTLLCASGDAGGHARHVDSAARVYAPALRHLAADEPHGLANTARDDCIPQANGLHPVATFADRMLGEATSFADISFDSQTWSTGIGFHVPVPGSITGLVFTEDGMPARQQLVVYSSTSSSMESCSTDDEGRFRIERVGPGRIEIRVGGGDEGLAQSTVDVPAGGTATATLTLRRERCIAGRAIDSNRAPLRAAFVEFAALDGSWADGTATRSDGTFVLANLPAVAGRLLLRLSPDSVPVAVVASVMPDSGHVVLDVSGAKEPKGGITVRVPEPPQPAARTTTNPTDDEPPPPPTFEIEPQRSDVLDDPTATPPATLPTATSVFAWQEDSHLGFAIPRAEDGAFVCRDLPAGTYRLEFRSEGLGAVDLGAYWVDGKNMLDLGTVHRPQPAHCVLRNAPRGAVVDLYHRRSHGDVRMFHSLLGRSAIDLPAGSWLALWQVGEGPLHRCEFVLRAGETTTVDLAN